jgi:uncharacterized coiled-coil protein SlyX
MIHHKTLGPVILGLLSVTTPSLAQDNTAALVGLCTAAISRPSNSVTSFEREQFARTAIAAMCQTGFNTISSFNSAAAGLNLSIPIAGALFGLGASGKSSDEDVQQSNQQICHHQQSSNLGTNVSFLKSDTVTDAMAESFQFCVGKLAEIAKSLSPSGLVATVTLSGENTFNIFAKNFSGAPIQKITDITRVSTCTIEGKTLSIGQTISLDPPKNEFIGSCQRASPTDQSVAVSTNEGVSNIVAIPAIVTFNEAVEERLNELETSVSQLHAQMDTVNQLTTELQTQIQAQLNRHDQLKASINEELGELQTEAAPEPKEPLFPATGTADCGGGGGFVRQVIVASGARFRVYCSHYPKLQVTD